MKSSLLKYSLCLYVYVINLLITQLQTMYVLQHIYNASTVTVVADSVAALILLCVPYYHLIVGKTPMRQCLAYRMNFSTIKVLHSCIWFVCGVHKQTPTLFPSCCTVPSVMTCCMHKGIQFIYHYNSIVCVCVCVCVLCMHACVQKKVYYKH